LCDWAKELQLKPQELRNELLLSKDRFQETAWNEAAEKGHVQILEKLWNWAKELQLKPEELRNELMTNVFLDTRPIIRQHEEAVIKY
jgi:hypothetical protein